MTELRKLSTICSPLILLDIRRVHHRPSSASTHRPTVKMDAPSAPRAFPLPSISEDTLHYVLHPARPSSTPAAQTAQGAATVAEDADLTAQATLISSFVSSLLPTPWLWNKDPWELKAVDPADTRGAAESGKEGTLEGRMRVGDAVDDEWLVVWLLREVSRRWGELVIS